MTYQYARIDLSKNKDTELVDWQYLYNPDIAQLKYIYKQSCAYKRFVSVMPMFDSQFTDSNTDVIGYYDNHELVAFSLIKRYDNKNALCSQFAWNYHSPKLQLGMASLRTECAIYRDRDFKYLYLDQAHLYKQKITGFELLGPL